MSDTRENRPLADLLGGLATDISMLFRKEVQLAKVEASEKVSQALAGVASIAIGGVQCELGSFATSYMPYRPSSSR